MLVQECSLEIHCEYDEINIRECLGNEEGNWRRTNISDQMMAAVIIIDTLSFVWGALVMAVLGYVGQKPMRREKDAASPLMSLG